MKNYRSEAVKNNVENEGTSERRVVICYPGAGEPCDRQLTFDEFVSDLDVLLANSTVPNGYSGLLSFLSSLSRLGARSKRFSRRLLPLLPDFLGTGIEHCLACVDSTYLNWGFDIEPMLLAFFPGYHRMEVFANCNLPLSIMQMAMRHSTLLSVDEMEVFGILIPEDSEGLSLCNIESSYHEPEKGAVQCEEPLPAEQIDKLSPYLAVLVEKGYCREDNHWISTREDGGHAYTQAAWITQRLVRIFPEIRQYKLGQLLGIRNINSYTSRVDEDAPFKEPIRRMFREKGLALE